MYFLKITLAVTLLAAASVRAQLEAPLKLNLQPAPEIFVPTNDVRRDATVAAVERAMPSVVNVATESLVRVRDSYDPLMQQFFEQVYGPELPKKALSIGSGVIIDEDGYMLTNDHVVRRANKIQIQLASTHDVFNATVIAHDASKDIALLKIEAPPGTKFTAIKFAHDDDLLLGETVLALGNPFGLGGSVSRGIVSSKEREVTVNTDGAPLKLTCLQTDAAINPGNSGGPLVNLHGELIGLNSAIRADAQGISFAVPARQVNEAIAATFTPESMRQLWFGARVKVGGGPLTVTTVDAGSPAAIAGLKIGDTILEVNGQTPRGFVGFNELLAGVTQANVALAVERNGENKIVTVRLIPEREFFNDEFVQKKLGLKLQVADLTKYVPRQFAALLGVTSTNGFLVTEVEPKSSAAANLARGAVITAVDGQSFTDVMGVAKLIHGKNKGDLVRVSVVVQQQQGNQTQFNLGVLPLTVR